MRKILIILFVFLFSVSSKAVVTITKANSSAICNEGYVTLVTMRITEGNNKDLKKENNVTLILTAPTGYEFNPGVGSVSYTAARNITAASISVTATTITITYSAGAENAGDQLSISGIQVKATAALPIAASGDITRTGGTATIDGAGVGSSFSTLTQSDAQYIHNTYVHHPIFTNVAEGSANNEIMRIRIRRIGLCGNNLNLEKIYFTTTGSTDPANDILRAKLYYTGTSDVFTTTTLLNTYEGPNGDFTLSCNQVLPFNYSYFWLTYDISPTATDQNIIDAQINSIEISNVNYFPNKTLTGHRVIGIPEITSNGTGGGNWNDPTSWIGGVVPTMSNHAKILNGDVITLTANGAECVDLILEGGATGGTLNMGSYEFTIWGEIEATSPGNVNSTCNSSLSVQDLANKPKLIIPSGISKLKKLTLNRATGVYSAHSLDLDDCVPADSVVLVLTNGELEIAEGSKLLLQSPAIQLDIPCSDASYVKGLVSRVVVRGDWPYCFPTGDAGVCRKYGVQITSGGAGTPGIHEVRYFNQTPPNYAYINWSKLPGGINNEFYWWHQWVDGPNPARYLFYKPTDFTHLTAAQRSSDLCFGNNDVSTLTEQWSVPTTNPSVNDVAKYVFLGSNASNPVSYWTIGSKGSPIVLPIELLDFKGEQIDNVIKLDFKTASEINNDYFSILKSDDAINYTELCKIKGAGNSNMINTYFATDSNPYPSANYYILKQIDFDGKTSDSEPIFVNFRKNTKDFVSVFPNPICKDGVINILISDSDDDILDYLLVSITDSKGTELFKRYLSSFDIKEVLKIKTTLKPSIYILNLKSGKFSISKQIMIIEI